MLQNVFLRNYMHVYLYFFFCVRRRRGLGSPLNKVRSSEESLRLGSCPSLTRGIYTLYSVTDNIGPRADALESHGPNAPSISQLRCSKQVFMHSKPSDLQTNCLNLYFPNIFNWQCSLWTQNLCNSSKCILLSFFIFDKPWMQPGLLKAFCSLLNIIH